MLVKLFSSNPEKPLNELRLSLLLYYCSLCRILPLSFFYYKMSEDYKKKKCLHSYGHEFVVNKVFGDLMHLFFWKMSWCNCLKCVRRPFYESQWYHRNNLAEIFQFRSYFNPICLKFCINENFAFQNIFPNFLKICYMYPIIK